MQQCVFYPNESAVWGTWSISACSLGCVWWVYLYPLLLNMDFSITPQQIFHVMVGFVIYCGFFIVSTSHYYSGHNSNKTTIHTLAFEGHFHIQNWFIPTMSRLWSPVDEYQLCILSPVVLTLSFPNIAEFWNCPHFDSAIRKSDIYFNLFPPSDLELRKKKGKQSRRYKNVMKD